MTTPEMRNPWRAWIIASRPRTLPAALAPVIVGTAVAIHDAAFQPLAALAALRRADDPDRVEFRQ